MSGNRIARRPEADESEAQVLGALLIDATEAETLLEALDPSDFGGRGHREVFEATRAVKAREGVVDQLLVVAELRRRGTIDRLRSGALGVHDLVENLTTPAAARAHAERVVEAARDRRIMGAVADAAESGDWEKAARTLVDVLASDGGRAEADAGPLRYMSLLDLLEEVERVETSFLVDPLWPADAYGVIGAQDKSGKTWAMVDLAVSIVTGTPWLGLFPCEPGPVLLLYGEGGARNLHRRLDAVARGRGLGLSDLLGDDALRIALAVPRLSNADHLRAVDLELSAHPRRAVLLDPLYLAAPSGKGADLYAMGEALYGLQAVCQGAGAALVVSVHWNKTGEGTGASRFSGVGPSAWGRVLGSAAVVQSARDTDGASVVTLGWEFSGGEIPETTFRTRRRVWAEDRHDLSSPMHYKVERVDDLPALVDPAVATLPPAARRVLDAIGTEPTTVRELGDLLARDGRGRPLKVVTIQKALRDLQDLGLVDGERPERPTEPGLWWAT